MSIAVSFEGSLSKPWVSTM